MCSLPLRSSSDKLYMSFYLDRFHHIFLYSRGTRGLFCFSRFGVIGSLTGFLSAKLWFGLSSISRGELIDLSSAGLLMGDTTISCWFAQDSPSLLPTWPGWIGLYSSLTLRF